MRASKGFRNIQKKNKIFGLEFFDLLVLLVIYLVVFIFSTNLVVNVGIIVSAYWFLKLYKKGKPPHWTSSVVRFLTRPRRYPSKREKEKDIFQ